MVTICATLRQSLRRQTATRRKRELGQPHYPRPRSARRARV